MMFRRFGIHLALIFLFAFAQISAVTHGISHVEDAAKHSQTSHSQQDSHKQNTSTHTEQCEQCLSFAKIAGGLPSQSFEFPVSQANFIGNTQLSSQALSQPYTAYAARAPPSLS